MLSILTVFTETKNRSGCGQTFVFQGDSRWKHHNR